MKKTLMMLAIAACAASAWATGTYTYTQTFPGTGDAFTTETMGYYTVYAFTANFIKNDLSGAGISTASKSAYIDSMTAWLQNSNVGGAATVVNRVDIDDKSNIINASLNGDYSYASKVQWFRDMEGKATDATTHIFGTPSTGKPQGVGTSSVNKDGDLVNTRVSNTPSANKYVVLFYDDGNGNTGFRVGLQDSTNSNYTLNDTDDTTTRGYGAWVDMSSSVPEPTSGMLMLLGLAGLALKRKRA